MIPFGIVVAAGSGERFGRPKAHLEVGGVPLWRRARDLLTDAGCVGVVVVGDVPGGIPGGARRRDSVAAGLAHAPAAATHVLVHDAARPLASPELVAAVLDRLEATDVEAVVPAVPVTDTVKRVEAGRVVATVDRADLVVVQTPQGFRARALRAAHAGGSDATDDVTLVEDDGGTVVLVDGDRRNLKLTTPLDLEVAALFLASDTSP